MSRRVPPNVHNANIRFHFNGFHTRRRYQQESLCLFCGHPDSEDSIEHITMCNRLNVVLPHCWKSAGSQIVPASLWFLAEGNHKTKLLMACFIFSIYTVHNQIRHSGNTTDLKHQLYMSLSTVKLHKALRRLWELLFHNPRMLSEVFQETNPSSTNSF